MTQQSILGKCKLVAFVATTDSAKARTFYEGVLGLKLVEDQHPFALVFDANGTMLRVTAVREHNPAPFTVLGWDVASIEETVERLTAAGVEFQRYPGVNDGDPENLDCTRRGAYRLVQGSRPECVERDAVLERALDSPALFLFDKVARASVGRVFVSVVMLVFDNRFVQPVGID